MMSGTLMVDDITDQIRAVRTGGFYSPDIVNLRAGIGG